MVLSWQFGKRLQAMKGLHEFKFEADDLTITCWRRPLRSKRYYDE